MNVLLDQGLKQPVVAKPRVPLVQPFDLGSYALVDAVVLAGSHRMTSSFPSLRPRNPAVIRR